MTKRNIIICPRCGGTGTIAVAGHPHNGETETEICPHCKGSGRLVETIETTHAAYTAPEPTANRVEPAEPSGLQPLRGSEQVARYPYYAIPNDPASIAPHTRYLVNGAEEVFAENEDGSLQRAMHLNERLIGEWLSGLHGHVSVVRPMLMSEVADGVYRREPYEWETAVR